MIRDRRRRKDNGCGSVNFLRYLLFIYNFLFNVVGLAILLVGLWTVFFKSNYASLLSATTYSVTAYLFVLTGIACIVVGITGCLALSQDSRRFLLTFASGLLIIFLLEVTIGILAYIYSEQLQTELKENFKSVLYTKYSVDDDVTKAANLLHRSHTCCGATSFTDWYHSAWYNKTNFPASTVVIDQSVFNETAPAYKMQLKVPSFCCKSPNRQDCGSRDHPSNIYYDGCFRVLLDEIRGHSIILAATALGVSMLQLFGVFIALCLRASLNQAIDRRRSKNRTYNDY